MLRFTLLLLLLTLTLGCQSARSIADSGSNAVAAIETASTNVDTDLHATPANVSGAIGENHVIQKNIPAVASMPGEILKLEDQWDTNLFGGKFYRLFWTCIFVGIIIILIGIIVAVVVGAAGISLPGQVGVVFRAIDKVLSGIFPLSAWVSHIFASIHTTRLVTAAQTTTATVTVSPTPPVAPAPSVTTTTGTIGAPIAGTLRL